MVSISERASVHFCTAIFEVLQSHFDLPKCMEVLWRASIALTNDLKTEADGQEEAEKANRHIDGYILVVSVFVCFVFWNRSLWSEADWSDEDSFQVHDSGRAGAGWSL